MKVFKLVKLFTVMNADAVSVSGGDGRQMEENPSEVNESYSCGKLIRVGDLQPLCFLQYNT